MNLTLKEFHVTFGQQYPREPHPRVTYAHHDGWLTVMAYTYEQARELAFKELGRAWSHIYEAVDGFHDPSRYPLGSLARVVADRPPQPVSSTAGNTLIDAMIMVFIIGLLASMAIPAFKKFSAGQADIKGRRGEVKFYVGDRIMIEGKRHVILKVDDFYVVSRTGE